MTTPRWKRVTAARFDEMLNVLPPLDFDGRRFLVSEPISQTNEGRATYAAFVQIGDEHFECQQPLTRQQFRQVVGTEILESLDA